MSDLFIGEMLVLVLLLPVFLRPFIRGLQWIQGIPLLPLLALLLSVGLVAGIGLPVSLAPVLLLVFVAFVHNLPRLVNLFRGLPTDWYGFPTTVVNGLFLAVLTAVATFAFIFAAENRYVSSAPVERRVESVRVARGARGRFALWGPGEGSSFRAAPRGLVLYAGDMGSGADGRPTAAAVLAENGYLVLSVDFASLYDFRNPLMSSPPVRRFGILLGRALRGKPFMTDEAEIAEVHQLDFARLAQAYPRFLCEGCAISSPEASVAPVAPVAASVTSPFPLFLVIEGDSALPVLALRDFLHLPVSGTVCLASGSDFAEIQASLAGRWPADAVSRASPSEIMPGGAERASLLVLTTPGDAKAIPGELACDDVLAARLLGYGRDSGRKGAELTARRLASWFSLRESYLFGEAPR